MGGLCNNCKLNNICEIYSKHRNHVEIYRCSYKDLIASGGAESLLGSHAVDIHRNRDMSVDLKTLYPKQSKSPLVGTCGACGKEHVELEECNECHKLICWECACTNIDDDSVYCPDCMSSTPAVSVE